MDGWLDIVWQCFANKDIVKYLIIKDSISIWVYISLLFILLKSYKWIDWDFIVLKNLVIPIAVVFIWALTFNAIDSLLRLLLGVNNIYYIIK